MKKYIVLNVVKDGVVFSVNFWRHSNATMETVSDVEQAIERLHSLPVKAVFLDTNFTEQEMGKIEKIGKLLHPDIDVRWFDFSDASNYESVVYELRKEQFKKRMLNYTFEDNPNLNNPFLNLDRTNIFDNLN